MTSSHLVPPRPGRTFVDLVPSSQSYRGTRDEGRTPRPAHTAHLVPGRTHPHSRARTSPGRSTRPGAAMCRVAAHTCVIASRNSRNSRNSTGAAHRYPSPAVVPCAHAVPTRSIAAGQRVIVGSVIPGSDARLPCPATPQPPNLCDCTAADRERCAAVAITDRAQTHALLALSAGAW